MVAEPVVVEFRESRRDSVVRHMVAMAEAGGGWINFSPGLDLDVPPPPTSPLTSLFSSRGPTVPLATWMAAHGRDPATAGIQHPGGPGARAQLAELGAPVPDAWRVVQDHPRRGLVVVPPPGISATELDMVLAWLLTATGALCPWPRTGEWRALCHIPG
jgi:hypothetical protein